MDGIGICRAGHLENTFDIEIRFAGGCRTDVPSFVSEVNMHGVAIELGVHGDGMHAELTHRAYDPNGDLPSVGDQDRLHRQHPRGVDQDEWLAPPELYEAVVVIPLDRP